jgi:hypothetical protein
VSSIANFIDLLVVLDTLLKMPHALFDDRHNLKAHWELFRSQRGISFSFLFSHRTLWMDAVASSVANGCLRCTLCLSLSPIGLLTVLLIERGLFLMKACLGVCSLSMKPSPLDCSKRVDPRA